VAIGLRWLWQCWPAGPTWRWRRIPNWLTVPGLLAGHCADAAGERVAGLRPPCGSRVGTAAAVALVFLRSPWGAGAGKLGCSFGFIVGPVRCLNLLMGSFSVAGIMAVVLVIYKRRSRNAA